MKKKIKILLKYSYNKRTQRGPVMNHSYSTVNPASEKIITTYEVSSDDAIERVLARASDASHDWSESTFAERAELLMHCAKELRSKKEDLAALISEEMGKPITQSFAEIEKSALVCDYYAKQGAKLLAERYGELKSQKVVFEPLGVVLGIMPWNFPFWQVFRWFAPSVMAGNTCILQHALNVSGCSFAACKIVESYTRHANLLQNVVIPPEKSKLLSTDPRVQAISLTGSNRAGSAVASLAGEHIKKTLLELGGSDPYIVLADAAIDAAARLCAQSRLVNSGQSCIAAKRMIVVKSKRSQFEDALEAYMSEYKVGEPMHTDTDIGPLARSDLKDALIDQVERSLNQGARLILGGKNLKQKGYFYPPTILSNVEPGMASFDEEVFGPVASIVTASDENEAIRLANQSIYGLGAAIFTQNMEKADYLARKKIKAGSIAINGMVKSDPALPFGGIKASGYGRELAEEGIKEFINIKTIVTT
jgi:succinate-semialdehyde dehydrogenase/glutarate-semialdehyde dehydrogenase